LLINHETAGPFELDGRFLPLTQRHNERWRDTRWVTEVMQNCHSYKADKWTETYSIVTFQRITIQRLQLLDLMIRRGRRIYRTLLMNHACNSHLSRQCLSTRTI